MRDLAGFREAVEQYRKQVGRTEEELARELFISKGELNKRLHDYSHPQSRRTWRLKPEHIKKIVETLAQWGAITSQKQATILFDLTESPFLKGEIDWQASPWKKLHPDPKPEHYFPPVRRRLFQARDLPKDYVPRPKALNEIKRLLLNHQDGQTTAITTALRGAGGFGKTTLASALCHDPDIQAAFPDGILWVELGEKPSQSLVVLNELLHTLEPSVREALTLEEVRDCWKTALEERVCLLVIDDVWHKDILAELLEGGPLCERLVTTRNDQLLPEEIKRVWVDAMEPEEAMTLLCQGWAEDWHHTLQRSILEHVVVQQLGCWPLLVSLARGMLTNQVMRLKKTPEQALALVEQAYKDRGMMAFHLGDRIERQRTADACLEVNLRQLEEWMPPHYQARQRYQELAVFPEDTDIPLTTLQTYWQGTGDLKAWEVEDLCLCLTDLSLLLPWDMEHATIRLHHVMRSYLIQHAGKQVPALHQRLLDAYQQKCHSARWANLPQQETYLWQHLILHLCKADQLEGLQATLTDLLYLTHKALYLGVSALEADLVLATTSSPNEGSRQLSPQVVSLHRMIMQSHHLLQRVSTAADMGGLLLSYLEEEKDLITQRLALERDLPRPFLTTWHPLPQSASALVRTLSGHTKMVTSCAVSPDGRFILSASYDKTLKVWDVVTGRERYTLAGHREQVRACAFSPDGQWIVSASDDETLKVWEVATGGKRLTLRGHTGGVTGCAVSPDGRWIVSASADRTLKVWETATGKERLTLGGHTALVNDCAISPDGKWIVSTSGDRTLKVWERRTGHCALTFPVDGTLHNCAFHSDGEHLVACGRLGIYFLRLMR